jgi:hypothetical protein
MLTVFWKEKWWVKYNKKALNITITYKNKHDILTKHAQVQIKIKFYGEPHNNCCKIWRLQTNPPCTFYLVSCKSTQKRRKLRKKQGLTSGWSELVGADGHSVGSCVQQPRPPSATHHPICLIPQHMPPTDTHMILPPEYKEEAGI